jgi:hypothetical protein
MDINVKLYLPFVVALNKMKAKYGEDFERLNSLHNDQLSDTDFIDILLIMILLLTHQLMQTQMLVKKIFVRLNQK